MPLNPVLQSHADFLVESRKDHFTEVNDNRKYTNGEQTARLNNDQLSAFEGGKDPEHVVNICPTVLNAKCDRLNVKNIDIILPEAETEVVEGVNPDADTSEVDNTEASKEIEKMVARWLELSGMDAKQHDLYFATSRDADAFITVDFWNGNPRFSVGLTYDGDTGVDIVYQDDDPTRPVYATKRWKIITLNGDVIRRLNIYYPNRIEKYINTSGGGSFDDASWLPFIGDGDEVFTLEQIAEMTGEELVDLSRGVLSQKVAVSWWTDEVVSMEVIDGQTKTVLGANGTPLGIAVIHFPNNAQGLAYGRSDLADVVPSLQDNLNDASVDLRIATKFTGSPLNLLLGADAVAKNYSYTPGAVIAIPGENVRVAQFDATDLEQLIKSKDSIERDISTVSDTPLPMINPTAQVAAEGTLQQQEAPLIVRVEKFQVVAGSRFADAARLALRLDSVFGELELTLEVIETLIIQTIWQSAETRNAKTQAETAKLWIEAGVEPELVQQHVLGMTPAMIEENKRLKKERVETEARINAANIAGELAAALQEEPRENAAIERESTEVTEETTEDEEPARAA